MGKDSKSAEAHKLETFAAFKKGDVVKVVVSGNPESVDQWVLKDSSGRVIKGILMFAPDNFLSVGNTPLVHG